MRDVGDGTYALSIVAQQAGAYTVQAHVGHHPAGESLAFLVSSNAMSAVRSELQTMERDRLVGKLILMILHIRDEFGNTVRSPTAAPSHLRAVTSHFERVVMGI